jgi:hypothetical protein
MIATVGMSASLGEERWTVQRLDLSTGRAIGEEMVPENLAPFREHRAGEAGAFWCLCVWCHW